jgi:hypothetical protein
MSIDDLIKQVKSDNEDIKFKLDAILNALILPRLGNDKTEIRKRIEKQVKGEVARKVWNSINGERSLAEIGKGVKQKPQGVLNYIKRWEQTVPPLVYVCKTKDSVKIYKRIFEIKLKKPETKKSKKEEERQKQSEKG